MFLKSLAVLSFSAIAYASGSTSIHVYDQAGFDAQSKWTMKQLCDFQSSNVQEYPPMTDTQTAELRKRWQNIYDTLAWTPNLRLITIGDYELEGVSWIYYDHEEKSIDIRHTMAKNLEGYLLIIKKAIENFSDVQFIKTMINKNRIRLIEKLKGAGAKPIENFDLSDEPQNRVAFRIEINELEALGQKLLQK